MEAHAFPDAPDLLIVGPATRDLLPNGGWRLGGTVVYGALAAARLGLRVGVLTSAPADLVDALRTAMPHVRVAARHAMSATTFENVYDANGMRTQHLRARCEPLGAEDVPQEWRLCAHVWLAPLAADVDWRVMSAFPATTHIAATPQGWLRQWDEHGRVSSGTWAEVGHALQRLDVLVLSDEDLRVRAAGGDVSGCATPPPHDVARDEQVAAWRQAGAHVVVTQGDRGATLLTPTSQEHFPAHPVACVDPTGAGDVFAAALLRAWWWGGDVRMAMRFANAAASFVIERAGTEGVPTYDQVVARLRETDGA